MLAALTMEKARGKSLSASRTSSASAGERATSRPLTPQDRAERQLAAIERFLTRAYLDACEAGRKAVPEETLERFIAEAGSAGLLKADAPATPELAWNLTANLDFRVLGQSYEIVTVSVERFDEIWQKDGAFYVPPSSAIAGTALTETIARSARAGVFVPPPVVADLSGEGRFAFLNGRNAYLYTRSSGYETIPLAVSRRDAARLKTRAGNEPHLGSAATGGDVFPVGSLSRPYADLSDAISYVASIVADRFFSAVLAGAIAVGEREAVRLAGLLDARGRTAKSDVAGGIFSKLETALDFETPNYGALAELQRSAMNLIREFTEEQRGVVLAALRDGVERGINPREMARAFRGSIGLTRIQEGYVQNYRNALTRMHMDVTAQANAMGRALHDNRFNASLRNAVQSGTPLSAEKIEQMVARYRDRFIAYRAETIARTQGLRAVNMAEQAVWEEAVRRGDVKANEVECTWMTARDERVRASHRAMNGQKRMMGKPFLSGALNALRFPGDPLAPPADVIACRCTLSRQLTAEPIVEPINEGETVAGGTDADDDVNINLLAQPKTPKGYRSLARRVKPAELGEADDLFDSLPYGYGRDPGELVRIPTGGRSTLLNQMTTEELQKLTAFYRQQMQTKLDRSITAYLDVMKSDLPKGAASKMVGKTFELPFSSPMTMNARLSASEGSTILQVKLKKGTITAFVGAERQGLALPPGAKVIVKSVRKLTPAEYLAETGAATRGKNLPAMLNPKGGYTLVEVEVVDNLGKVPAYLEAFGARSSSQSMALKEVNELIARNRATAPVVEDAATVKLTPKKGDPAWNVYMKGSFDGANDTARKALNTLKPVEVITGKDGPYYASGGGQPRQLSVFKATPSQTEDFGIFRHELGHYIDDTSAGMRLLGQRDYASARMARDVAAMHERWREIVAASKDELFYTFDDVSNYLASQFGVSPADMRLQSTLVTDFLQSHVAKFEAETGFKLGDLFGKMDRGEDLLRAVDFARAVDAGDVARMAKAIGNRHSYLRAEEWSARDELAHGFYDLIGSVSRLEWGGGHSREYYLRGKWLLEGLPGGDDFYGLRMDKLTSANTEEAFANWFNLYTRGPGERAILRKIMPGLHNVFESHLESVGGAGFSIRFW